MSIPRALRFHVRKESDRPSKNNDKKLAWAVKFRRYARDHGKKNTFLICKNRQCSVFLIQENLMCFHRKSDSSRPLWLTGVKKQLMKRLDIGFSYEATCDVFLSQSYAQQSEPVPIEFPSAPLVSWHQRVPTSNVKSSGIHWFAFSLAVNVTQRIASV